MAEPAAAAFSPATSPSSEPPSAALSPTADGTQRFLFTYDLVSGKHRGSMRFGLVRMIHGEEEDFEDSDSEVDCDGGGKGGGREGAPGNSDNESGAVDACLRPLGRGFVRVQWYPEGTREDVRETKVLFRIIQEQGPPLLSLLDLRGVEWFSAVVKPGTHCVILQLLNEALRLKLEDRSIVPRDFVRRMNSKDKQCGVVINLNSEFAVKLIGTNCVLYPVKSKDVQNVWSFMYGDHIVYDFWLGKVYDLSIQIIVKLSNGARCSMSEEDGQVLIGPSKVFANVQWLYGVKPVLSKKSKFRVVVEEVQVVELKVTWITKSYSPKGFDSVFPPPSTITRENIGRVKKLLKRMFRKEPGKKTTENSNGSQQREKKESEAVEGDKLPVREQEAVDLNTVPCQTTNGPAMCQEAPKDPSQDTLQGQWCTVGDADSEEDAGEDTDDASSVTSSASSTASLQSIPGRKKSIPLSIRNLKRKHKKKRTKFSREVAVEVVSTVTTADVMWKNGQLETGIRSNDLIPIQHLDNHEFCPGDYVVDKRPQAIQDSGVYGVIQSGDHRARTCAIKWVRLNAAGDDVEVIEEEEDVSVYDISDHPDFHFHTTDIVIRIGNPDTEECETERSVGQVCRVDLNSKVEVVWCDNSKTIVLPQHLYNVEIEESYYDSAEASSSGASSEEWEDESDSWETDNGQTEEELSFREGISVSSSTADGKSPSLLPSISSDSQGAQVTTAEALGGGASEDKPRGFRELKEALKILESLKNMTVEQLWTGSPTSPTAEPSAASAPTTPSDAKPTKEKRFLEDIKKLQENLKKTLDNVAIVEGDKMETAMEEERAAAPLPADPQTPVRSEWPSDTPVLCQQSGGKPGVTFTSAIGEVFSVLEWAPDTHSFKKMEFQPAEAKKFFSTVRKEMALLATSLPDGIMVKTFEDRMDLFSALIKGPNRTPYEDGLFLFDIQLPNIYPAVPPLFHYLSQCSGRLNPNLYDNGKGTERWTSKSSLLQVLISIQGLILVNEPYYNEAGFDSDRGLQEGYENSRCYNEMALIKMVQSMMQLLQHPVEVFQQEILEHFAQSGWRLLNRLESWLELDGAAMERAPRSAVGSFYVEPLEEIPSALAHSSPSKQDVRSDEDLEDSGLSPSTVGSGVALCPSGEKDVRQSDGSSAITKASETLEGPEGISSFVGSQQLVKSADCQPTVRPKKRRKSYRSFLPERSGYPDIGFPLFPLSKGFVKSMRGVLQHYRACLTAAGVPQDPDNK
ncbi:hypothetical protein DNTS_035759 [Danionella cerebrum]|uniref:(E3-independent) E2 ubiquitin-conjugating enzyme n=1 Tax=Danionella cerebrum TaxID=2873325 RepID=A0A553MXA4_9TELE|nr:hypothetical protein DNTS_035759 [Danionella translucida]